MAADFSNAPEVIEAIGPVVANNVIDRNSFYFMVKSANVLLKSIDNNDIYFVAKNQAYPRIGLILTAAKTKSGNLPLFPLGSTITDYDARYEAVIEQIDLNRGIYASGIRRVAAYLTASVLTRNIALQSSIQQVSAGDMMEKQALDDLDRIISLYDENTEAGTAIAKQSLISLFISLGINRSTVKETEFDVRDPAVDPTATTDNNPDGSKKTLVELTGVKTYKTIPYQGVGKRAYCWYYLTGTNEDRPLQAPSIEGIFEIKTDTAPDSNGNVIPGWGSEDVIEALADRINNNTVNASSNILLAPNKGQDINQKVTFFKKRFYPDTTTNANRRGSALVDYRVDFLSFDVRRYSNTVQRELIIISFYTVDGANTPTILETTSKTEINAIKQASTLGVEGLWYGASNSYIALDENGPQSIIVQVEKTHSNAIAATGGSANEDETKLLLPDTFYFRQLTADVTNISGTLRWRASTTPSSSQTVPIEGTIETGLEGMTAEELSLAFLNSLYTITERTSTERETLHPESLLRLRASTSTAALSPDAVSASVSESVGIVTDPNQGNNILGALVHPNAVQIVPFRSLDYNTRAIIDIIEIPENLEIATGTPLKLKSPYVKGNRSVVVEAIPLDTKLTLGSGAGAGAGGSKADSEIELLEKVKSSAEVIRGNRSRALQAVYDKLDFLNTRGR